MAAVPIRVMVSFGPWLLSQVEDLGPDKESREQCQRCDKENLRYIYVVELQKEPVQVYRIGSKCGPDLIEASEEVWGKAVRDVNRSIRLLHRLDAVISFEAQNPAKRLRDPNWAAERRQLLLDGTLDERKRKQTGFVLTGMERAYLLRDKKR